MNIADAGIRNVMTFVVMLFPFILPGLVLDYYLDRSNINNNSYNRHHYHRINTNKSHSTHSVLVIYVICFRQLNNNRSDYKKMRNTSHCPSYMFQNIILVFRKQITFEMEDSKFNRF